MSVDLNVIGEKTVKSLPDGNNTSSAEHLLVSPSQYKILLMPKSGTLLYKFHAVVVQLKSFWHQQTALVVFFRRWGCVLCRLWAKELSEIAPVLRRNNVRLIGIGVEEEGSKKFLESKFFDGELYCVENMSTYHAMGYKKFNVVSIITSLFWKQSRAALSKGRNMGLGTNLKGDWGQVGGALLVDKDGKVLKHFVQTGPGDHYPNEDILKQFGLEAEYNAANMANKDKDGVQCAKMPTYQAGTYGLAGAYRNGPFRADSQDLDLAAV